MRRLDQERSRNHAQNRRREKTLFLGRAQKIMTDSGLGQYEGEFADLSEAQCQINAEPDRSIKPPENHHNDQNLDAHHEDKFHYGSKPVLPEYFGIEQHADGNKKNAAETIAQRQYVSDNLMAQLGFRNHESGDQGAERE